MASSNTMKLLLASEALYDYSSDLLDFVNGRVDMTEAELDVIVSDVLPTLNSIGFTSEASELLAIIQDHLAENSK